MNKRLVSKNVIDVVSNLWLLSIYGTSDKTLQDKAKTTLVRYGNGQWNSAYTTFIEKKYE